MAPLRGLHGGDLERALTRFEDLVMRILRRVARSAARLLAARPHPSADDLAVIPTQWVSHVDAEVLPALAGVYRRGAAALADSLATFGHDIASLTAPEAADFLAAARNRLVGVAGPVWEAARDQLVEGTLAGEGITDLAARVQRSADVGEARARVIARTECLAANNAASYAQALLLNDPTMTKQWLATPDARTRETHRRADGQTVPLTAPFEVGEARLLFPGDPMGPLGEVISCRCAPAYHFAETPGGGWPDAIVDIPVTVAGGSVDISARPDSPGEATISHGGRSARLDDREIGQFRTAAINAMYGDEKTKDGYGLYAVRRHETAEDGSLQVVPVLALRPAPGKFVTETGTPLTDPDDGPEDEEVYVAEFDLFIGEGPGGDFGSDTEPGLRVSLEDIDQGSRDGIYQALASLTSARRVDTGNGLVDVYTPYPDAVVLRVADSAGSPVEVVFSAQEAGWLSAAMDSVIYDDASDGADHITTEVVETAAGPVEVNFGGRQEDGGFTDLSELAIVALYEAGWEVQAEGPQIAELTEAFNSVLLDADADQDGEEDEDDMTALVPPTLTASSGPQTGPSAADPVEDDCGPDGFCRHPLHPGPCKGHRQGSPRSEPARARKGRAPAAPKGPLAAGTLKRLTDDQVDNGIKMNGTDSPKGKQLAAERTLRQERRDGVVAGLRAGTPSTAEPVDVSALMSTFADDAPMNLARLQVSGPPKSNEQCCYIRHLRDIPRKDMPQLPTTVDDLKPFAARLSEMGVSATLEGVDPRSLTATQSELNSKKVGALYNILKTKGWKEDGVIIVSEEGAILDGHHRWAAASAVSMGEPPPPLQIKILRVAMPIDDLLAVAQGSSGPRKGLEEPLVAASTPLDGEPTSPPPNEDEPWLWIGDRWYLIATDTTDGVPESLDDLDGPADPVTAAAAVTAADGPQSGAMVALVPSDADAARLAVDGGPPAAELHCRLFYLGKAASIPDDTQVAIVNAVRAYVDGWPPVQADGFAVSLFNPGDANDRDTCVVLGLSGDDLDLVHEMVEEAVGEAVAPSGVVLPEQHQPWVPHATLIYTDDAGQVGGLADRVGPVVFDRVRVAFGGECVDIPLDGEDPPPVDDLGEDVELVDFAAGHMPAQLRRHWIRRLAPWGPGSFRRCVRAISPRFPADPEGTCANLYKNATGRWPGANKGHATDEATADLTAADDGGTDMDALATDTAMPTPTPAPMPVDGKCPEGYHVTPEGQCVPDLPVEPAVSADVAGPVEHFHTSVTEGLSTGLRMFAAESISWRTPPFAFHWQVDSSAHGGTPRVVQVGCVTRAERVGDTVHFWGTLDLKSDEGRDYARRLVEGFARWSSVSPDEATKGSNIELVYAEPTGADGAEGMFAEPDEIIFHKFNVAEITAVSVPALADATVEPTQALLDALAEQGVLTAAAVGAHSTATSDESWDGPAAEKRLDSPMPVKTARKVYAWVDDSAVEDGQVPKSGGRFPHHDVAADGTPGAANVAACSAGIAAIHGARGGSTIPDADRRGVYDHLREHLVDSGRPEESIPTFEASPIVAAGYTITIPDLPPAAWFDEPADADLPPFGVVEVDEHGRLWGLLAPRGFAGNPGNHRSFPAEDVKVPMGNVDYSGWMNKRWPVAEGHKIFVGVITMDCGHASTNPGDWSYTHRREHYDNSCSIAAHARVYEKPGLGVCLAGAAAPWLDAEGIGRLMSCDLSGDWPPHPDKRGWVDFTAALAVPVGGFPNRVRVRADAGVVVASAVPVRLVHGNLGSRRSAEPQPDLRPTLARIARSKGRDPLSRMAVLRERVHSGRDNTRV